MRESQFFRAPRSLTVAEIAALVHSRSESKFSARCITDIAALDRAGPSALAFASGGADESSLSRTRAGACLITESLLKRVPPVVAAVAVSDPYTAFVRVAEALFPDAWRPSSLFEVQSRPDNAGIHPTARLETGVVVEPGATIGPRAEIGSGSLVGPLAVIGPDVRIGRDCVIGSGACLTNALVGDRVIIQSGARIGDSPVKVNNYAVPVGRVVIQDGVEIGANSTVQRGTLADTVIGEGARIASLASISSDVMIARHCVILRSVP